jgi:hypothetical protein
LFPEAIFEGVFSHVLQMCVRQGMVGGSTQAIDSAPIKANASMDSLELKVPERALKEHLAEVRQISKADKETFRKAKENKASRDQQKLTASAKELQEIKRRNKNWGSSKTSVLVRETRVVVTPVTRRTTVQRIPTQE